MNKKASHVGMILSFVVFVSFVIFLFTILNPAIQEQESKQTSLNLLKKNLIENISSSLSVTSLKINSSYVYESLDNCLVINEFTSGVKGAKIKDEAGNSLEGFSTGSKIKINHGNNYFFRIYHSLDFGIESLSGNCDLINETNYTLSSTRDIRYVSEERVFEFLEKYEDDYEGLKFGLGVIEDFGISFTNSSEDEIQKGFESVSGNVYIEEIPIQYYDSDANLESGSIKIRVW
jgi:hypothetical protein